VPRPRGTGLAGLAVVGVGGLVGLGACGRRAPIASCQDDLRGVYVAGPEGAEASEAGERWMVIDNGAALEAYALFPDSDVAGGVVAAPRVIDLVRRAQPAQPTQIDAIASELTGTLHRRYMRGAGSCDAQVPVHVTRCAGDALELVLADPSPPLGFAPCTWPRPGFSHTMRWRRE